MLNAPISPGSRWTQPLFPLFPSIPFPISPSFADGREHGDTGCRGRNESDTSILDFVTQPMDSSGSERSFRC
jgi:hypothetical protein